MSCSSGRCVRLLAAKLALKVSLPLLLLLFGVLSAGCVTRQVQQTDLSALRKGVAGVREQSRLALTGANQLAREQSIARVVALKKPALAEAEFVGAVAPQDIVRWDNAFATLDQYLTALQNLTSPDLTKELEDAAVGFGNQLATGSTDTAMPPGVATAFTQLGKALVEARANQAALDVMRHTDGPFRQALTAMAEALYDPATNSGLRGTVLSNWNAAINGNDPATPQSRWGAAIQGNADDKTRREIVDDFLQMLDARDAQLAAIDGLRQSLGMLADAHGRAAQGHPADAAGIVAWIDRQLTETQAAYQRFKSIADAHAAAAATQPSR